MRANGISFIERDVKESSTVRRRYEKLNPRRSVPTIQIDDEVVIGFNSGRLERAIDRAAEERLDRF